MFIYQRVKPSIYGFSIAMFNHQMVYPDGVEDKHDDFTMVICDSSIGKIYMIHGT